MMFSNITKRTYNENISQPSPPIISYNSYNIKQVVKTNTVSDSNKMRWGKPVWYFLHSMAEKVKTEEFHNVRNEMLEIIYLICTNLPCPYCSHHAKIYLDNINFKNITSKNDLKHILYMFHNNVNKEKGYELFDNNNLDPLYSKAHFLNITNNFLYHFNEKYSNTKLINGQVFRSTISKRITNWIKNNINKFN